MGLSKDFRAIFRQVAFSLNYDLLYPLGYSMDINHSK